MTKEKGLSRLWIESDSLNIINYLNGVTPPSWTIANIIKYFLDIVNKLQYFKISHEFQEGNQVENYFTNLGVISNQCLNWELMNHIPIDMRWLLKMMLICGLEVS